MKNKAKVTIHMVASLDGFISKPDGSIDWLHSKDQFEKGVTLSDEDIAQYVSSIDCYVMGSGTYEHALQLGWPYGDVSVIVVTRRELSADRHNVQFYEGDLRTLVNDNLASKYQNIWMVGGAMLTKEFLRLQLADQIILSMMPILIGEGTLFFDSIGIEQLLHLTDVTAYKDGMVELSYDIIKD